MAVAVYMGRFEHGGDIYAHPGVLDYSASLNPLGMPRGVIRALRDNVGRFDAYPDPWCRELRADVAAREHVSVENIVCTAGATDLIARIASALPVRRALVEAPCYSGYEQELSRVGAQVHRHALRSSDNFDLGADIADDIVPGLDAVFLASPNNPTSRSIDPAVLDAVLAAARGTGTYVVVDECFADFTEAPSAMGFFEGNPHLIVMKAFTKAFSMAGLRLGYGVCSDAALVERLVSAGQPWAVSTPAQIAGIAALREEGYLERTRGYVRAQRELLADALSRLGMRVVPGEANFLLFQSARPLYEPLLERGVLVRRCENYHGLDGRWWYRVAVRKAKDNMRLVEVLEEVCR